MEFIKDKKVLFTALFIVMLAAMLTLSLAGCQPKATITVQMHDNVRPQDYHIENALVVFTYGDGSVETINVTLDMLSKEDAAKLTTPGVHTITINYRKKKSIEAKVNLLRPAENDVVFDRILQGVQKAAPHNNINGELKMSAYYQLAGEARKEYSLSLQFTLDVDGGGGAENYLGLEVTEDNEVLVGLYYKDDTTSRPNMYIKTSGIVTTLLQETQTKLKSVSADEYFGEAQIPTQDELWTLDDIGGIVDTLLEFLGDDFIGGVAKAALSLIEIDSALADDGTALIIDLDLNPLLQWLPLVAAMPDVANIANDFLESIGADFTLMKALTSLAEYPPISIKAFFDDSGALQSLGATDKANNEGIKDLLKINIKDKLDAGINIDKISIRADDTSFSLPQDRGLENWDEGDVSFERWVLLQYRQILGYPLRPATREGIEEHLDIDYVGDGDEFHKLDVYRPTDKAGQDLPVIIHVHGGGWVHGRKEEIASYSQYLALQDFAVVNINYHLIPTTVLPEPIQDIFAVFNFVIENAEQYGFDTKNVFITGDSAGGHYAMLALSVLLDPELSQLYGVNSIIKINGAGVSSTGFTFTDIVKLPIPFAHFYVNQFFSDDLPYTAYRDDPRYQEMAKSLNLENNRLDLFPPMFVSSAYGDIFNSHSDQLVEELKKHGIDYIYDFRTGKDAENTDKNFLGHDFNITAPDWQTSKIVNTRMCEFFKTYLVE